MMNTRTFRRKKYLGTEPLSNALKKYHDVLLDAGIAPLPGEAIRVQDALGRVTSEAVVAGMSYPFYHSAAMDGIAVRSEDTFGASETRPKRLRLPEQAVFVDTGDPMPEGMNAVIMIEEVEEIAKGEIEILRPATPWQGVRVVGEDIVATELIIPENHKIRPIDIAAMLAAGIKSVNVRRRPVVSIIPTGDELVEIGSDPEPGSIIDFNSYMLAAMTAETGAAPARKPIVRDDPMLLRDALIAALSSSDVVLVNAGSSAGREDFTAAVIDEIGSVIVHGVGIKPGKPAILGIAQSRPVIGIPGYPVSAAIVFDLFVRPLLFMMQGLTAFSPDIVKARLSRQVASSLGQEEFLRVKLGRVSGRVMATPLGRGAGAVMSLVRADGIVRIPAESEGIGAGQDVDVELIRPIREIDNTIVCIGSHDNALDILADHLKKKHPTMSFSSAHVGSVAGLLALKRGESHMAGTHLLDEETGEYNAAYIKRLLPPGRTVLVNFLYRDQGFIVPRGNPKNIRGFLDLTRKDVVFVNRQAGSGTRLLTDLHLRRLGIDRGDVNGYEREEYTHMAVAAAVLSNTADTGLGVLSAARALGMDFVPVARERYDLAIPLEFYDTPLLAPLLRIIREDPAFRARISSMGGYDVSDMGKEIGVF